MLLKNVGTVVVSTAHRLGFWTRRKSPELLIVGSIITAGASVILAAKATTHIEKIVKPANDKIKVIHDKMNDDSKIASGEYSIAEGRKELVGVYSKTGWELTKLYGPSALAFSLSVASLLGSHKIMKGRNVALAAMYTTLENGYKGYRERVRAKIGETAEKEIFRNIYPEETLVTETDKKGNEKEVTKNVKTAHMDPDSDYGYLFDSSNPDWNRNGRLNIDYLLGKEKYLNQRLIAQGYLFLYDVYNELGIEPGFIGEKKLQASKVVGWIYDPEDPERDNYVSFGLADAMGNLTADAMEMLRQGERNVWLEFNPDGDILTGSHGKKTFMKYAKI